MSEAQKYPTYTSDAESGLERLAFSSNHPPLVILYLDTANDIWLI
jgi:hypothetical protein